MGVYENKTTTNLGTASPNGNDSSLYGVNKFKASLFMFIPNDNPKINYWNSETRKDDVSSRPPFTSDETMPNHTSNGSLTGSTSFDSSGKFTNPPPEVTSRRITITRPKMDLRSVSETVAVRVPPCQPETRVVTHLEFQGHKRYKNEVKVHPQLRPEKYSETCYVYINSTRKRYVSRTFLKPRLQHSAHAETLYVSPKTVSVRYEVVLNYLPHDGNSRWFKTCLDFRPKLDTSTIVKIPPTRSYIPDDKFSSNENQGHRDVTSRNICLLDEPFELDESRNNVIIKGGTLLTRKL